MDNTVRKTIIKETVLESKNVAWEKLKEIEKALQERVTMVENITGDETSDEIYSVLVFHTHTLKNEIENMLTDFSLYSNEAVKVMKFYEKMEN